MKDEKLARQAKNEIERFLNDRLNTDGVTLTEVHLKTKKFGNDEVFCIKPIVEDGTGKTVTNFGPHLEDILRDRNFANNQFSLATEAYSGHPVVFIGEDVQRRI